MGVGVHQHIRTGVSCGPLHRLHIAAGDHQLIGRTGVAQTVEYDTGNSGCASCHFRNFLRMSTGSTARPLGRRNSIPLSW